MVFIIEAKCNKCNEFKKDVNISTGLCLDCTIKDFVLWSKKIMTDDNSK